MVYDDPLSSFRVPFSDVLRPYAPGRVSDHLDELLLAVAIYQGLFMISSVVSPLVSTSYRQLKYKHRIDFNIHVVSMFQSILILWLSWVAVGDPILTEDRVFGYTPYVGFVCAFACGYFIWDALVSLAYVRFFGPGFLVHGIMSTIVFGIGLQPYILHYCPVFLLFELSTPFLNLRWFGIRFPNLFSATFNLANNAVLILIFFFVRICYGWYQVTILAIDFYNARDDPRFVLWWSVIILACNLVLDVLNVYWFGKMCSVAVKIITGMFSKKKA